MTAFNVLYFFSVYSSLIPLILGILFFRHLDISSKLLLLLLTFANVAQFATLVSAENEINIFYNIYTIIDLLMWGMIFAHNIENVRHKTIIIFTVSLLGIIYLLINISNGFGTRFYHEFVCINSVLQVVWVLSFFYQQYTGGEIMALEKQPMFWICLGLLMYAPCTYFVFAFYDVIIYESSYPNLTLIHSTVNVFMYLIFSIGMYMNIKHPIKA